MIATYVQKLRLFSRGVRLYLITWALLGFCWVGIYNTLLNLYLLRLGFDPELIGLVNGIRMIVYAIFCLVAGALGGRWGVRRMLTAGLSVMLLGAGLMPLAGLVPRNLQPVWVGCTLTFSAIGGASYLANGTPFLMSATDEEERDHVFSVWSALLPLAGFAGSLVAGLLPGLFSTMLGVSLDQPVPYRYPLLIAAVLFVPGVVALLATHKVGRGRAEAAASEAGPLPLATIALTGMVFLLYAAGTGVIFIFFNVYLDAGLRVSTALVGTVMALGQLLSVPAALASPFAIARWGKGPTVVLGYLGVALSMLALALIPHWIAAALGFLGYYAMTSIAGPAFYMFTQEAVSPGRRPLMSGTTSMAEGVSFAVMAMGGGYAMTALGYRSPFLIAAFVVAAGALLFWAFFLRTPRGSMAWAPARDAAE